MNYYCAKFNTNISTNMDTTNIFPFLSIFAQNFTIPPQKKIKFWTYSAYIVSKATNNDYAKFHAFIKKLTIDAI